MDGGFVPKEWVLFVEEKQAASVFLEKSTLKQLSRMLPCYLNCIADAHQRQLRDNDCFCLTEEKQTLIWQMQSSFTARAEVVVSH